MIQVHGGMNPKLAVVLSLILNEVMAAEQKHPTWPEDELRQAAVVAEEAGELLQAQLTLIEEDEKLANEIPILTANEYIERDNALQELNEQIVREAAQTGAMVVRFLMNRIEDGQADTPQADPTVN